MPDSGPLFPSSLPYGDGHVPLIVRAHPRARRIALKIDHAGDAVEMVLPRRCSRSEALRFLEASRGWIDARLATLPPRVPFADGAVVPVMDVPHAIHAMGPIRGKGPAWIEDGVIHVTGDPAFLTRRVRDFLRASPCARPAPPSSRRVR